MFVKRYKKGSFEDIVDVSIHYGRGRTLTPSGFVVVNLKNGEKMQLNEFDGCVFIGNNNVKVVQAIQNFLKGYIVAPDI